MKMIFDARTNELEAFNDSNHVLTKNVLRDMWMEDKKKTCHRMHLEALKFDVPLNLIFPFFLSILKVKSLYFYILYSSILPILLLEIRTWAFIKQNPGTRTGTPVVFLLLLFK